MNLVSCVRCNAEVTGAFCANCVSELRELGTSHNSSSRAIALCQEVLSFLDKGNTISPTSAVHAALREWHKSTAGE